MLIYLKQLKIFFKYKIIFFPLINEGKKFNNHNNQHLLSDLIKKKRTQKDG